MKRLVLVPLLLLLVFGWQGYANFREHQSAPFETQSVKQHQSALIEVQRVRRTTRRQTTRKRPVSNAPRKKEAEFQCDGRTRCSQMTSCAEAMYFLKNCPGVEMDGDRDGIPCEQQWCNR
ncbi:MAG TPA: excalibur calcium-binding domain-containing protein [Pyrinomonadaceae bacterium]|nr:excalibur calcium-binding domain-containing protein [Pyrinomonadaceae bacterium]